MFSTGLRSATRVHMKRGLRGGGRDTNEEELCVYVRPAPSPLRLVPLAQLLLQGKKKIYMIGGGRSDLYVLK